MTSAASLIPPQLKLLEAVEKPTTPAPALNPMAHKIVYLIRHGQSTANAAPSWEEAAKPEYRDASLTDLGKEQARALQDVVADWGVQTIYCSPMTRAMQTACLVFEKETAPLIAWPVITGIGSGGVKRHMTRPSGRSQLQSKFAFDRLLSSYEAAVPIPAMFVVSVCKAIA
eukprot:TRINITY_DN11795_c1_g3_i7.p3 TRINITY_DN11795_c1_g3~~TRINITY_DN11795_c1_g3_i7.p3  ORF type:complete len:171 (+),score=24.28 TRINITY_DN11795_c1_g3_i7:261-773(+)